jgi:hypothetical protein
MKRVFVVLLLLGCVSARLAAAGSRDDALRGGLIGAALGAIVGNNSSDIRQEVAIPVGAALGALAGYHWNRYSGWYDDWSYDRWDRYRDRGWYDGYRYDYRHPRYAPRRRSSRTVYVEVPVAVKSEAPSGPAGPKRDASSLHPGISLVRIPVTMANGVTVDVRILEVNGRYVGPRGEIYRGMPTAEMLAERYFRSAQGQPPAEDD